MYSIRKLSRLSQTNLQIAGVSETTPLFSALVGLIVFNIGFSYLCERFSVKKKSLAKVKKIGYYVKESKLSQLADNKERLKLRKA